jgi:Na+-transporting NADH:ubiquinone oxidoreductase subunit NqrE
MTLWVRMVLFLQCGFPGLILLGGISQLLTSQDDPSVPRWRLATAIYVPLLVIGIAIWSALRLGRGRRFTWAAALVLNLALAVAYGMFAVYAVTAKVPEGMLAFSGLLVGVPLVLLSLAGVGLLLARSTRALCLSSPGQQLSYPA